MSSSLPTLLKEARAKAKLTQEGLAKAAGNGLTANDISKAERGLSVPSDTQLRAIAKACGVTQKSLVDAAHPETAKKAAAKKPAAAKTTAKKPAAAKSTTAKKTTAAKKTDAYTLTATEKKMIDAYRSASPENRKLALSLLQGKDVSASDINVSSVLGNGLAGGLGSILGNLIGSLGK